MLPRFIVEICVKVDPKLLGRVPLRAFEDMSRYVREVRELQASGRLWTRAGRQRDYLAVDTEFHFWQIKRPVVIGMINCLPHLP